MIFFLKVRLRETSFFQGLDASEPQLAQAVHAAHVQEFTDRFEVVWTRNGGRGVSYPAGNASVSLSLELF